MANDDHNGRERDTAKLVAIVVLAIILIAFIVVNTEEVNIDFIITDFSVPLIFVLAGHGDPRRADRPVAHRAPPCPSRSVIHR